MKHLFKVAAGLILLSSVPVSAQKPAFNPNEDVRDAGMVTPTVIDKMIAVNSLLGKGRVDWKAVGQNYKSYMDKDDYNDAKVMLPVVIGMRMSDGVLSIMGRDIELLNATATDIEFLAKKLGAEPSVFKRANKVKAYANAKDWNRVFLELGFLQKEVLGTLEQKDFKNRRCLLIAAGWIEGAHMMSGVIQNEYSADTSGLLREPLLVKQMIKEIEALDKGSKSDLVVISMLNTLKSLHKIVDVPKHGSVSLENVTKMHKLTSNFRKFALKQKK